MKRQMQVKLERFPIAGTFTIARGAKTEAAVVRVIISSNGIYGHGECVPYGRYGESLESVISTIEELREEIENGCEKSRLQNFLPAGAARNAIDCALWDFEAKQSGTPAHITAGVIDLNPLTTAYTISLDSPENMYSAALKSRHRPILKIKLGGKQDLECIEKVRAAAPDSILIADANEGWTADNLMSYLQACYQANFALIEQPLPSRQDEILRNFHSPVPLCADESVHDRDSLTRLRGIYQYINIKLDKTGGLTEALALCDDAQKHGFKIMVGCMVGTSLAMAPAFLPAMRADFVDLDGPLLLARDRENGLTYRESLVEPPAPSLWG